MSIGTVTDCADWQGVPLDRIAARAAHATLTNRGLEPDDCEIAILGSDDAGVAALNLQYRGRAAPTNVLSWPAQTYPGVVPGMHPSPPVRDAFGEVALGDIALAYQTCAREAAAAGLTLENHLSHLVVHGTLHLLGYDHETGADGDLMESLETRILSRLGIADPYGPGANGG